METKFLILFSYSDVILFKGGILPEISLGL